ncbi:unnamed protein product [Lactuca saligna]|uniref:Uncharacterized protein n=1 Tax=Lactuca saligna TaxID=75948 RepID=A0AA35V4C0_LACSI|nr:unnamed protein product [Lactuca saligna]
MEGMASIALLLDGSISGHFVQLPESVYYQMGQSRLFVSTSYLSVKQPTTPTPPSANPKPFGKNMEEVAVVVELITKLHEDSLVFHIQFIYDGYLLDWIGVDDFNKPPNMLVYKRRKHRGLKALRVLNLGFNDIADAVLVAISAIGDKANDLILDMYKSVVSTFESWKCNQVW